MPPRQTFHPLVRVGIALGEVVVADDTVTGEGIVLAQRLEQLANPGGVCLQGAVYDTVPKRLPFTFTSEGEHELKGFDEPVRVYAVAAANGDATADRAASAGNSPGSPDRPRVAVLPFTNMSGDPEQEYFSDGISEDIITQLSRFKTMSVVARNSTFAFKGAAVDIDEISEKLNAQYVLEGSVRRAGSRIRISAQLIETATGNHLWAERYDRDLEDLFAVQDDVTRSIVAVLPGRVQEHIVERASRKPTQNMKAYELMLQGKAHRDELSARGNANARRCCEKAIELDPRYARAYMYLSDSYIVDLWLGLLDEANEGLGLKLAREAATLDGNDVYIQDHLGFGYLSQSMWTEAESQFNKTMSKIVNEAESMAWCGYAFLLLDQREKAYDIVTEAMRLDPLHPPTLEWIMGQIHYLDGRYDDAIEALVGEALLNSLAHAFLTGAYAHLGRTGDARIALANYIHERHGEFESRGARVKADTVLGLAGSYRAMWKNPASWERLADGLQLAGLEDDRVRPA